MTTLHQQHSNKNISIPSFLFWIFTCLHKCEESLQTYEEIQSPIHVINNDSSNIFYDVEI
jgi:hypothetical protein